MQDQNPVDSRYKAAKVSQEHFVGLPTEPADDPLQETPELNKENNEAILTSNQLEFQAKPTA